MKPAPLDTNVLLALAWLNHQPRYQQVNDAYLVEVARRQRGRLVTLDTRLPVHAREENLVFVIPG